jgi:MYXO-CTERM domain-containing protein
VAFAACLVAGSVALPASRAAACSTKLPPPALEGFPKEGSVDVPTDVVPVFDRFRAAISDPNAAGAVFELTSASGQTIAVTTRQSHVWHFELVPAAGLAPLTRYTLKGRWRSDRPSADVELSLSFTTGDGPVREAPKAPAASMQHYTLRPGPLTSCDLPAHGTCVAHGADGFVEHFDLDLVNDPAPYPGTFGAQGSYLYERGAWTHLTDNHLDKPYKCVRLRTRAANGTYSEPVVLCEKDAPHYQLIGSPALACTAEGLAQDGKVVTGSAAGPSCSFTSAGSGAAPLVWLALAAMLALQRRRRRSAS